MRKINLSEGFTLIELMIVVAIIGILAAIAIPNFIRFTLRSKASEGKVNLETIRAAEHSYFGEYGTYIQASLEPPTTGGALAPPISGGAGIGAGKRPWGACVFPPTVPLSNDEGFCIVGFEPEGPTYYDYGVNTQNSNDALDAVTRNLDYFAVGNSDIDDDDVINEMGIYVPPLNTSSDIGTILPLSQARTAPAGLTCQGDSILNDAGQPGLGSQVGPCQAGSSVNIF